MKSKTLARTIISCTLAVCITLAAMYFVKPALLCWYFLAAAIGFVGEEAAK